EEVHLSQQREWTLRREKRKSGMKDLCMGLLGSGLLHSSKEQIRGSSDVTFRPKTRQVVTPSLSVFFPRKSPNNKRYLWCIFPWEFTCFSAQRKVDEFQS